MARRNQNPYTLADLREDAWPDVGDYLWIDGGGTLLVMTAGAGDDHVAVRGYACQGPIGDGVAWSPVDPHQWRERQVVVRSGDPFRILPEEDWPRLPQLGDWLIDEDGATLTVDAASDEGDAWHVAGPLNDNSGAYLGEGELLFHLNRDVP